MILVALGTHPQPMNRLLRELDRLVRTGRIREQIVVQSAAYDDRPSRLTLRGVMPSRELEELIGSASVVISHGGPGVLSAARAAGRVPVVVPRQRRFGEHVDDHQVRYARRLAGEPGYEVVVDVAGLEAAIDRARRASGTVALVDRSRAIAALRVLSGCG